MRPVKAVMVKPDWLDPQMTPGGGGLLGGIGLGGVRRLCGRCLLFTCSAG